MNVYIENKNSPRTENDRLYLYTNIEKNKIYFLRISIRNGKPTQSLCGVKTFYALQTVYMIIVNSIFTLNIQMIVDCF